MIGMAKRPTKFLAFVGLTFCTLLQGKNDLIQKNSLLFGCFSKMGRRPINKMLIWSRVVQTARFLLNGKMLIPLFAVRSGGSLGANR